MEAIKLSTKLGNCKLNISAQLRNDMMESIAKYALQYLIWHVIPAEAYSKESDYKRESAYSDALGKHLQDTAKTILGKCFSDVKIETSKAPDKMSKIEKLIKEFIGLGMDEASAKAMAAQVQAKVAKPAEKTEEKVEAKVETTVEA